MTDDSKKTALDRELISLEEKGKVRDWTKSLGCPPRELCDAVKAVGNSAAKVCEYLSKKS